MNKGIIVVSIPGDADMYYASVTIRHKETHRAIRTFTHQDVQSVTKDKEELLNEKK